MKYFFVSKKSVLDEKIVNKYFIVVIKDVDVYIVWFIDSYCSENVVCLCYVFSSLS